MAGNIAHLCGTMTQAYGTALHNRMVDIPIRRALDGS
jgi:hypothetical protein